MAEQKPKPKANDNAKAEDNTKAAAASLPTASPPSKTTGKKTAVKKKPKAKAKAEATRTGPKGLYQKWLEPEGLVLIRGWARNGLTLQQIADSIGINQSTLCRWQKDYEEISKALKSGKEVADLMIENALFNKAARGDTTAMIFYLKNRRPMFWRDRKPSEHEADDAYIQIELERARNEAERSRIALEKERIELKMLKTMAGESTENALAQMKSLYDLLDNPAPDRTIDEILGDETVVTDADPALQQEGGGND